MAKGQDLKVIVEDGELRISVGVDVLPTIIESSFPGAEVNDPDSFAIEIMERLTQEADDGTTLVHEMFDRATDLAAEDGCASMSFE